MAECKPENTANAAKVADDKETPTVPEKEVDNVESVSQEVPNNDKSVTNDSCDKDLEIVDGETAKEPDEKITETKEPTADLENLAEKEKDTRSDLEEQKTSMEKVCDNKTNDTSDKADKSEDSEPVQVKSEEGNIEIVISEEEDKLNEILKVVYENLSGKNAQQSACKSKVTKENSDKDVEEENVTEKSKESVEQEKESVTNQIANTKENVPMDIEVISLRGDSESKEPLERLEDSSEVGIVGPPTAVSELVNEDELRVESALSTEKKVQDHVAEWVQNSVKAEQLANTEEEESPVHHGNRRRKKNLGDKRTRKKRITT